MKNIIAAAASMLATAAPALATSTTGSVAVSSSVSNNCSIGAGTVAFGSYDPVVANLTSALSVTGSFTISCTKGDVATISLDAGSNGSHANGTSRAMASGSNYLSYELYKDSAHATVWNATNTVSYTSAGKAAATQSIYGSIPAGQDVPAGANYADTITVTASF